MQEIISFVPRMVDAKGIKKGCTPNQEKLKEYLFEEEIERLELLKNLNPLHIKHNPTLFYPGSGCDIFTPLFYVHHLFKDTKEFTFHFQDQDSYLAMIKTMLDDVGISFSQEENKLEFFWYDQLITLHFEQENVFKTIHSMTFDIYFEKAFRIIKQESSPQYEDHVYNALDEEGIIISDSGFFNENLEQIETPKELSSYNQMIIARKRKEKETN